MQMQLPIFPETAKLINSLVGFYKKEGIIYYLHNGSPIFCHPENELDSYRYITANLVDSGLCGSSELATALGVNKRNIERYTNHLRKKGASWFFERSDRRGQSHKMTDQVIKQTQRLIDEFYSVSDVARMVGVSEGALRYHIKKGNIKKKWSLR